MKQMIHCCFTSHHEVMFRSAEDVGAFLNLLALSSWQYGVEIFSDTEMSNHVHLLVLASEKRKNSLSLGQYSKSLEKEGFKRNGGIIQGYPDVLPAFLQSLRKRYTWYFNMKYGRKSAGRLGEKSYYSLVVRGNYHMISACSYVLRNGLHHGVSGTAFAYPFSSVNDLFVQELGKTDRPYYGSVEHNSFHRNRYGKWEKTVGKESFDLIYPAGFHPIVSRNDMQRILPRNSEWPDHWVMSPSGVFLRTCFEELRQTELLFVSPGSFEYNMFRRTDDKWLGEQEQDDNGSPIVGIAQIEPDNSADELESYLRNERSNTFKSVRDDFTICHIIDHDILPEFKANSIYQVSESNRIKIRKILINDLHVPARQVSRCV